MTAQETLSSIFPDGTVTDFDPTFPWGYDVIGLPKGTVPQNCEVLASGEGKLFMSPVERRVHYLVKANGIMFYFRICTAMVGSGYDEFVAGLGCAEPEDDTKRLETRARQAIDFLLTQPPS
jgi:hypothetical protein